MGEGRVKWTYGIWLFPVFFDWCTDACGPSIPGLYSSFFSSLFFSLR